MLNAAEAMYAKGDSDGMMVVETEVAAGSVRLRVHDSGGGAPDPERIFDMHHTTKRERLGVGLSVSRALILANGGQLSAHGNDRGGLTAVLTLPMSHTA